MTFKQAAVWNGKIRKAGGVVALSVSEADILVVPDRMDLASLEEQHLRGKLSPKASLVSPSWLKEVINKQSKLDASLLAATHKWVPSIPTKEDSQESLASPQPFQFNMAQNQDAIGWSDNEHHEPLEEFQELSASPDSLSRFSRGVFGTKSHLAPPVEQSGHGGVMYTRPRTIPKESLACQKLPQHVKASKLNQRLIQELSAMEKNCDDEWRAKSYSMAVAIIRKLDFEVTSGKQIRNQKGIGKRMEEHIDEILETGTMDKRLARENDPQRQAIHNLKQIHGVGDKAAATLYKLGFINIQEIREALACEDERLSFLSASQRAGIEHYEDLQLRIPRAEMESVHSVIRNAADHVYGHVPDLVAEIVGSYRRGKETSGDIDIIITSPSHEHEYLSLAPLIQYLEREGLIKHTLNSTRTGNEKPNSDFFICSSEREPESQTFMGICLLPPNSPHASGVHRRIDIKSYPSSTFAFALLYFTGSAHFNRSMRFFARSLGYSLSDKGLAPCTWLKKDQRCKGESIRCATEEDVFHALGLEYREPKDRNCNEVLVVDDNDHCDGELTIPNESTLSDDDEQDDSGADENVLSDDGGSNQGPPMFQHGTETPQQFLNRCAPSSWTVRGRYIRVAYDAALYGFDSLDCAPSYQNLVSEWKSRQWKSREDPSSVDSAIQLCTKYECFSGKWQFRVGTRQVDDIWLLIVNAVLAGHLGTGAKVNTASYKLKGRSSVVSVYTSDFRNREQVQKIARYLRHELGLKSTLWFKSQVLAELFPDNPNLFVFETDAETMTEC